MKTVLVTGGAGFIGSCYVLSRRTAGERVVNLDKLTYSGNIGNLASLDGDAEHIFVRGDIGDALLVRQLLHHYQPDAVINFAAESHVDRSIHDPDAFVRTNVLGTCTLLRGVLEWWKELSEERRNAFRFLHVSTDEVYGTLRPGEPAFTETTPYAPNSPYSASKASSDHFVRAYHETYGLPTLITNCSNNYGPRQFPEKLIPWVILNCPESRCPFTAPGRISATGCMWKTTARPSLPSWKKGRRESATISAGTPSGPISMSSGAFAAFLTSSAPQRPPMKSR